MRLDVFTLFPEWFEWFESQRHVRNAVAEGSELRFFNYRDTTPLERRAGRRLALRRRRRDGDAGRRRRRGAAGGLRRRARGRGGPCC